MVRFSIGLTAKVALISSILFFTATIKFMVSLNTTQLPSSLGDQSMSNIISCGEDCRRTVSRMNEEIEMLKDQIRELQNIQKQTADIPLPKDFAQTCVNELSSKLARSDAFIGQSYPTERHVPTYTRFDMWHQYYVHSSCGEKVVDKLNGLQRVGIVLM